jgi:hypothetical protein
VNTGSIRPTAFRSVIRWITFLSFVATTVLIAGAMLMGSLEPLHQSLVLSCLGVSIGSALIEFLTAAYRDRRLGFLGSAATLLLSLGCYLAIVWGWGMSPLVWRIWWMSGLLALLAAHLGALTMIQGDTPDWTDRVSRPVSVLTALFLLSIGLRPLESLLAVPSPLYLWSIVALLVVHVAVTVRCWRRFVASKVPVAEVWKRSKLAF